jgi:hypothetical protein
MEGKFDENFFVVIMCSSWCNGSLEASEAFGSGLSPGQINHFQFQNKALELSHEIESVLSM